MTDDPITTPPKQLGYRLPAEWEPHAATWVTWPHNAETWPGKLASVQSTFAQTIAVLARSETVHINVNDDRMQEEAEEHLRRAGTRGDIEFHQLPTNDAWCRDYAAILLVHETTGPSRRLIATNWDYNAWGEKYVPFDLDEDVASGMAETLGIDCVNANMVLEGGSIDVNGQGLLLTTESCLLHPNRNPRLDRAAIERRLVDYLGVEQVLWLRAGIAGDDTDGHVDDVARFVGVSTVVAAVEEDPSDVNYQPLSENRALLENMRDLGGKPLDIVQLPMPPAITYQGERLPASYANFYIANQAVLMPGYHPPTDERAKAVLQEVFPDREIVVIDCTDIVAGLGAFHCLTQQVPAV
jgi:agmatine deiminase